MTAVAAATPRSCSQRSRRRLMTTIVLLPFAARAPGQVPLARQRERMLDVIDAMMRATGEQTGRTQLSARVRDAMARVPRPRVVPSGQQEFAYPGRPLPIGASR